MDEIFKQIIEEIVAMKLAGKVADYIPELAKVDPTKFGMHLSDLNGREFMVGDYNEAFSIQSISKIFVASWVFSKIGDKLWERVGREPSGTSFNSLVQLEYENGIPRNPLINAGAIVTADIMLDLSTDPKEEFLYFLKTLANDQNIFIDTDTYTSESETGFRNIALANFMKSFGNIKNNVDQVLDLYFSVCSIKMTCKQLSKACLLFANHGKMPSSDIQYLTKSQTKRLNALMQTCGFYDEAGDFSFKVGLPGKSGVGGGIVAILPGQYGVAVWSPILNDKGNSEAGMKALELLTTKTGYSIF